MTVFHIENEIFQKKNVCTIFVVPSYSIYVLAGFWDQIPLGNFNEPINPLICTEIKNLLNVSVAFLVLNNNLLWVSFQFYSKCRRLVINSESLSKQSNTKLGRAQPWLGLGYNTNNVAFEVKVILGILGYNWKKLTNFLSRSRSNLAWKVKSE